MGTIVGSQIIFFFLCNFCKCIGYDFILLGSGLYFVCFGIIIVDDCIRIFLKFFLCRFLSFIHELLRGRPRTGRDIIVWTAQMSGCKVV